MGVSPHMKPIDANSVAIPTAGAEMISDQTTRSKIESRTGARYETITHNTGYFDGHVRTGRRGGSELLEDNR